MAQASGKKFPLSAEYYELYEEVGDGVSATVYRALCVPLNETVAIKVLDLEKCNSDLDRIRREVQTMLLIDHPNLLRAHCSFAAGHKLWLVMPYMAGGSCLHIMKSAYPEGFEESIIATLLHEVLKALVYLHAHGHIHRDVKAGNILIDTNGAVKLADFGVAACMYDTGDRQRSRNTFVGTPCWMAPEVMQQLHGYDFKADIWSFGITALELAHGHAPFSKYPPMKVLLMTLQNAPPGLDYERDRKFSKSFREMIGTCLVKDPKKRPTSEKLLKHSFFKHARRQDYLTRILDGLPPLGERFQMLKAKEADILAQNSASDEAREHLSQQEYIRGISAWNFNLEDLRNQAALIQDDPSSHTGDASVNGKHGDEHDESLAERGNSHRANHAEDTSQLEDEPDEVNNLDNLLAGFPMKPLLALKGSFDLHDNDIGTGSPMPRDPLHSNHEQQSQTKSLTGVVNGQEAGRNDGSNSGPNGFVSHTMSNTKFPSGLLLQDNGVSPKKFITNGDREYLQPRSDPQQNYSGSLQYRQKNDFSNSVAGEETSECAIVEHRGRFKVTSAELCPKSPTKSLNPMAGNSTSSLVPKVSAASVLPSLQSILQHNLTQREEILKLMKLLEPSSVNGSEFTEGGTNGLSQITSSFTKERELEAQVNQMQKRVGSLVEELQRTKARNAELERKLNAVVEQNKT